MWASSRCSLGTVMPARHSAPSVARRLVLRSCGPGSCGRAANPQDQGPASEIPARASVTPSPKISALRTVTSRASRALTCQVGQWTIVSGRIVADSVCDRITELIQKHLKKVATATSGWDTLYRDPQDGRLWELLYLHSGMHGAGPPSLSLVEEDAAR